MYASNHARGVATDAVPGAGCLGRPGDDEAMAIAVAASTATASHARRLGDERGW